jgi:hypothetical protein
MDFTCCERVEEVREAHVGYSIHLLSAAFVFHGAAPATGTTGLSSCTNLLLLLWFGCIFNRWGALQRCNCGMQFINLFLNLLNAYLYTLDGCGWFCLPGRQPPKEAHLSTYNAEFCDRGNRHVGDSYAHHQTAFLIREYRQRLSSPNTS